MRIAGEDTTVPELVRDVVLAMILLGVLFVAYVLLVAVVGR